MVVNIFWLVVGGGASILAGGGWQWVVMSGGGWWWVMAQFSLIHLKIRFTSRRQTYQAPSKHAHDYSFSIYKISLHGTLIWMQPLKDVLEKSCSCKIETKSLKNTGEETHYLVKLEVYIYKKNFCKRLSPTKTFSKNVVHKGFNYQSI